MKVIDLPAAARALASLLMVVAGASVADAQDAPGPPGCAANPEAHQLDFWLGSWDVFLPDGTKAGENRIEAILGHCALLENWTSARGGEGKSVNFFDPNLARWRQLWIDGTGTVIDFDRGGLVGSAMQFLGTSIGRNDRVVRQRLTLHPVAPDTVRQLWEQSTDDGTTWQTVFDGLYVRQGTGSPRD